MKKTLLLLLTALASLTIANIAPAHNWGPPRLLYGDETGGIDIQSVLENGAWTNWFWRFHNRYSTKVTIYYTYKTTEDGTVHSNWGPIEPNGFLENNNGVGGLDPNVTITRVEFDKKKKNPSGVPAEIVFPAKPGTVPGGINQTNPAGVPAEITFPGPSPKPSPLFKPSIPPGSNDGWGGTPRSEGQSNDTNWGKTTAPSRVTKVQPTAPITRPKTSNPPASTASQAQIWTAWSTAQGEYATHWIELHPINRCVSVSS